MPLIQQIAQDVTSLRPSSTLQVRAETSSEAAALPNGEKALTPIIAGSISGACIGAAWLIALVVALVKHCRKRRYYKRVGKPAERPPPGVYIVPPDPAVLQGSRQPGERIEVEKDTRFWEVARWKKKNSKGKGKGRGTDKDGDEGGGEKVVEDREEHAASTSAAPPVFEENRTATELRPGLPPRIPHLNRLSTIMSMNSGRTQIDGLPSPEAVDQNAPASSYLTGSNQGSSTNSQFPSNVRPSAGTAEENDSGRSVAGRGVTEESYGDSSERPLHRYPPSS